MIDPSAPHPPAGRRRLAPVLVGLLAAASYANTLGHDFVWDDLVQVAQNPSIRSLSHLPKLFAEPYWASPGAQDRLYRPVTMATLALDWAVGKGAPRPFHLTNLFLHAAASVLVWVVCAAWLSRLGLPPHPGLWSVPFVAGALFAVHPVHTDAVNLIVQRSEILATLGVLVSIWACWRSENATGGGRIGWLAAAGISFGAGLGSKETAVVLPLMLAVFDGAACRRAVNPGAPAAWSCRAAWPKYLIAAAVAGAYIVARHAVLGTVSETRAAFGTADLTTRVATMTAVLGDYVRLLVFPHPLCADYAFNVNPRAWCAGFDDPRVLTGGILLLAAAAGAAWGWLRKASWAPWMPWVAIGFLPVANLIPIGSIEAERFCYLPSVGACAALAALFAAAPGTTSGRNGRRAAGILVLCAGLAGTWLRNPVWADERSFAEALVADAPDNPFGFYCRGVRLLDRGQPQEAADDFTEALRIEPDYINARSKRALALAAGGRLAEACADLDLLLQKNPANWKARNNLALMRMSIGRPSDLEAAVAGLTHILDVDRRRPAAVLRNRAAAYFRLRKFREAAADLREYLNLGRGDDAAFADLMRCEASLGNRAEVDGLLFNLKAAGKPAGEALQAELEALLKAAEGGR